MFKRKCKITFISHGATVHTMDGIICDTDKYPKINEFGEEEIAKVCEYLKCRAIVIQIDIFNVHYFRSFIGWILSSRIIKYWYAQHFVIQP